MEIVMNAMRGHARGDAEEVSRSGLVICDDFHRWDGFCQDSAEGSPFMLTWFTDVICKNVVRYFWTEESVPQAAILVHLNELGNPMRPPLSVHHSICYSRMLCSENNFGNVSKRFAVLEAITKALTGIYRSDIFLSLHPKILDLRPLTWHNYDRSGQSTFDVMVRYTAVRDLASFSDINDLLRSVRKSRKEDYKKALKDDIVISEGATAAELVDLYKRTFERQGIEVKRDTQVILERLAQDLNKDRGFVVAARTAEGTAVAVTLVLVDSSCAYSLIVASDPAYRHSGANTACMMGALVAAKNYGKRYFDFVGANSPRRGDYKLSFRAQLQCYFEANLVAVEARPADI